METVARVLHVYQIFVLMNWIHLVYAQRFIKHEQTRLESILSAVQADSALACCFLCNKDERCMSVSYNSNTSECFMSETKNSEVSAHSVTDIGWTSYAREWLVVFRAVAGHAMGPTSWLIGTPAELNSLQCRHPGVLSCSFYRSPVLDNWNAISHEGVKYDLHQEGREVGFIIFNGTESENLLDWFSSQNVLSASWPTLQTDTYRQFNPFGWDTHYGRWFFAVTDEGNCSQDAGYTLTIILATDPNGCDFDTQDDYPQFLYSKTSTSSKFDTEDIGKADSMTISIKV